MSCRAPGAGSRHTAEVNRPQVLDLVVRGVRGRVLGLVAGAALVAVVIVADVAEGPATAYVGVLTAAPLLAAVFARPADVLAVGLLALGAGQAYAASTGAGWTHAQQVRLGFIVAATLVAVLAAALREIRDRQLQEVTDVAEYAQAAILRPVPSVAGSLALSARYRSAATAARVGGDFYDVASTEHGVRILLGDVRGKGLDAVRLAAAVLGSFRQAAFSGGADLAAVARAVSEATARDIDVEDFVTAVFLELQADGSGQLVRCGHPTPLRIAAAGARALPAGVDQPPLGLVTEPVAEAFALAPGERLLLYTDGLSEARDAHGTFFDVDRAAGRLVAGTLDEALDGLLAEVGRHTGRHLSDDLAVLLLEQRTGPAAPPPTGQPAARSRPVVTAGEH